MLESLRAVEKLLRYPTWRERFQGACIGADHPEAKAFQTWSLSLKSLRWEAVEEFTQALLQLESPLRRFWNKELFLGQMSSGQRSSSDEVRGSVDLIDKAITDPNFWAAVACVHNICYTAEYIGKWAEGCPCCEDTLIKGQGGKRRRTKWLAHVREVLPCPYRGCRAVDLAAGEWLPRLQRVLTEGQNHFTEWVIQAEASYRPAFVEDWVAARSKLWATLQVKLKDYDELPWKLCPLSDWGTGFLFAKSSLVSK